MSSGNGQAPEDPEPQKSESDLITSENIAGDDEIHEKLVESFVPGENEYLEKSNVTPEQAALFASWNALIHSDPDLDGEIKRIMELWAGNMLQGQISIGGEGRREIIQALETLGNQSSAPPMVVAGNGLGEETEEDDDSGGLLDMI